MPTTITLGRSSDNDVCLPEAFLSSKHAEVSLLDAERFRFRIRDLGSTNGTFVNGQKVTEAEFDLSDTVALASRRLVVEDFLPLLLGTPAAAPGTAAGRGRGRALQGLATWVTPAVALVAALAGAWLIGSRDQAQSGYLVGLAAVGLGLMVVGIVRISDSLRAALARSAAERRYLDLRLQALADDYAQKQAARAQTTATGKGWDGFRKFQLARRTDEASGITSFYFVPHDGKELAPFAPGQYLTLRLNIPGQAKPVIRCYSLSDCFRPGHYRISVKRAQGAKAGDPAGLGSTFLHTAAKVGDLFDIKAPSGSFHLDEGSSRPVVLLAAGVGITPMLSMLNAIVASGRRREVHLCYSARQASEFVRVAELSAAGVQHEFVNVHFFCGTPDNQGLLPRHQAHIERFSVDFLKKTLPSNNYEFFLCGPGPFMSGTVADLQAWGVPDTDIHYEAFGPSTVAPKAGTVPAAASAQAAVTVTLKRSGKTLQWRADDGSLLELCEKNGVNLDSGCRAGNCGTCQVALVSGKVSYNARHDVAPEAGSCLACIAAPAGDLTVDA